ncbi:hypothetical protein DFQ28_009488 [Apophysomyces sp. BC1034]|nr:hypothetical protein DFQ30_008471 [Apophysomyces sp. BC1015]KAG0185354.1 hypothetical protein DFQ28_009488 [Apophysomyces sp. BC1034]
MATTRRSSRSESRLPTRARRLSLCALPRAHPSPSGATIRCTASLNPCSKPPKVNSGTPVPGAADSWTLNTRRSDHAAHDPHLTARAPLRAAARHPANLRGKLLVPRTATALRSVAGRVVGIRARNELDELQLDGL